jgi:hypothetical protein
LDKVSKKEFHGHGTSLFLPESEQCKRIGVQTWSDYPESHPEDAADFAIKDIELMRQKMKATLTAPIAGK